MLMGFEALRDLPLTDVEVETPIETCMTPMIAGKKMAVVPILRAGLGMVNGILALVPSAKVGHIGLYRDEETHEPHEYYCKLPDPIDQRTIVVTDPMLATGGSAVSAIDFIKRLIRHIPEKHFKMIRYGGLYARHRKIDSKLHRSIHRSKHRIYRSFNQWRTAILSSFGYDPLKCPECNHQMEFLELYYNHQRVSLQELYEKAMSKSRGKRSSA